MLLDRASRDILQCTNDVQVHICRSLMCPGLRALLKSLAQKHEPALHIREHLSPPDSFQSLKKAFPSIDSASFFGVDQCCLSLERYLEAFFTQAASRDVVSCDASWCQA
jgi:hypothetical protein